MAEHIVSWKLYVGIWFTLVCMTFITWYASTVDLTFHGISFNPLVALAIAGFKAVLVILFFMHIKYSTRLQKVVIGAGFFWLLILLCLTMVDYLSRTMMTAPGS